MINFKPIEDTVNGIYHSYEIYKDEKSTDKKLILVITKQDTADERHGQIFVLERVNGNIQIIDSSMEYEIERTPDILVSKDTLCYVQPFHRGSSIYTFLFNHQTKKYQLVLAKDEGLLYENKKQNNVATGIKEESYNIIKQELTIKKFEFDEDENKKLKNSKTIKRALIKNFTPDLSHFPYMTEIYK